jgi:hypothetical protein
MILKMGFELDLRPGLQWNDLHLDICLPLCIVLISQDDIDHCFPKFPAFQSLHLTNTSSVRNRCVQVLSSNVVLNPVS